MSGASRKSKPAFAACVFELADTGAAVQLLPSGEFRATDGRPFDAHAWRLDATNAPGIIARANARTNRLVIDYEHQTIHTEWNGQPAPAAGWFKPMEYHEGVGLFAVDVDWTARAADMIAAKEYRYISSVFSYLPTTGEVLEILHAGLTNNPALDGMAELTARAAARFSHVTGSEEENTTMNPELLKLLGLAADASDEDIQRAVVALTARLQMVTALREALGVDEGADVVAAVTALKSATPDLSKYVPAAVVETLKTELAALRTDMNTKTVDELVGAALDDGRLLPAQEAWAKDLGKSDIAALRTYLDSAQPIAALRGRQTDRGTPSDDPNAELSEDELAVCSRMGLDPDSYKSARA